MDRRTKSRIDVKLNCRINAGGTASPVDAITENVSRTGMLMLWGSDTPLPKVARKLSLDVLLPENSEFGPRVMRCRAEVTRVSERAGGQYEVALRVLTMRFIDPIAAGPPFNKKRRLAKRDLASMPVATDRVI